MSNRRMRLILVINALLLVLSGCAQPGTRTDDAPLVVFAAASLTDAFTELGAAFAAESPGDVQFNFAGSNQLATQIAQDAPADVFASANEAQMAAAVATGRVDPAATVPFVTNRLVIITPADNPAAITDPRDLARSGLLLVLAAPEVPVGQYALDFLDKATADPAYGPEFREAVLANLVSSEANVRAVLTKVVLGEADAGIVYTSDLAGRDGSGAVWIDIPDDLNTVAVYPIAPLVDRPQSERAAAFVAFVLSPQGQDILARYGFDPVRP